MDGRVRVFVLFAIISSLAEFYFVDSKLKNNFY